MGKKVVEKKKKESTKRLEVMDLLIPAVSGIIFLLVLFFILIPSVSNSSDMLREIERVQSEQETLRRNLSIAEGLDPVILQRDLGNARKVLPRKLEVAQFAYYIDSLAEEKGLTFRELKAGDSSFFREEVTVLDYRGIRVPMGYSGDYDPILDFFDELQLASPYVISFGNKVGLNKAGSEEEDDVRWGLEIDLTGYYVSERDDENIRNINIYGNLIPYDSDEDLVQEFEERSRRIID